MYTLGDQLFQAKRPSTEKSLPAHQDPASFDISCKLIAAQDS